MNNTELLQLKSVILAETDSTFVGYRDSGSSGFMAEWLNTKTTTDAWKSTSAQELDEAADYATFDTIVAGKRDAWKLFLDRAPRDMAKNKIRKVVTDVWGNATAASVAESILQAGLEKATRLELLMGNTSATTGTVTGVKRDWTGTVSFSDIDTAMGMA